MFWYHWHIICTNINLKMFYNVYTILNIIVIINNYIYNNSITQVIQVFNIIKSYLKKFCKTSTIFSTNYICHTQRNEPQKILLLSDS